MKNQKAGIVLVIFTILVFVFLLLGREKLTCFVTKYQLSHNNITLSGSDSVNFEKDYRNDVASLTVLEFGGYGCKPCMRMDTVIRNVRKKFRGNVLFKSYKVTDAVNKKAAKFYNITAIPTQIIINKEGEEVFRNTGFITESILTAKIDALLKKED